MPKWVQKISHEKHRSERSVLWLKEIARIHHRRRSYYVKMWCSDVEFIKTETYESVSTYMWRHALATRDKGMKWITKENHVPGMDFVRFSRSFIFAHSSPMIFLSRSWYEWSENIWCDWISSEMYYVLCMHVSFQPKSIEKSDNFFSEV